MLKASHLFYVQKVFGFKVNSRTLDRTIFIEGSTVTHIGFHCKSYWFRLLEDKERQERERQRYESVQTDPQELKVNLRALNFDPRALTLALSSCS